MARVGRVAGADERARGARRRDRRGARGSPRRCSRRGRGCRPRCGAGSSARSSRRRRRRSSRSRRSSPTRSRRALRLVPLPGDPDAGAAGLLFASALLAIPLAAHVGRVGRAALAEVARAPFLTVARAKGAAPLRVWLVHALPVASGPIVTVVATQLGALLGGAVVLERLFERCGAGDAHPRGVRLARSAGARGGGRRRRRALRGEPGARGGGRRRRSIRGCARERAAIRAGSASCPSPSSRSVAAGRRRVLRAPERLDPARAWCAPSAARPFGCGEGGVDLLALVAHAELRGVALAIAVALVGFAIGTPLGAASALARGRLERGVAARVRSPPGLPHVPPRARRPLRRARADAARTSAPSSR